MKLSIITVNLNNANGLLKTMESVLLQTSHDFEYIIIDGGSTDGSVEVIKSFTDIPQGIYNEVKAKVEVENSTKQESFSEPGLSSSIISQPEPQPISDGPMPHAPCLMPISFWVSEVDRGIYHAMNKGIRVARGEYCQFLNSGDWLAATDVIEKMVGSLPDCSIYYGNMLKQMDNGRIYRDTGLKGNITMFTFYRGTLNHSPALIKRILFEKYGRYDVNLKIVSDWKWYLIVIGLNNEPVKYVDLDVTSFEMNGISTTNQKVEKKERRKVLEELLPANILVDYDTHWRKIEQANRIDSFRLTRCIIRFIERAIFKLEKIII